MPKQATGQPLRSAERTLDVLETFTIARPALSVAEICQELGLATSTVRRILGVLEDHGFVRWDAHTGRFAPHYQLVRLSAVALQGNDLLTAAERPLDELRDATGEATQLCVRSGSEIVFVDRRETQNVIKIFSPIGHRSPAWTGRASGKVLMAWLDPNDVLAMLPPDGEWAPGGPRAPRSRAQFMRELEQTRSDGFAINDEETERDVWAVAAPVRDHTGAVVAAVNIPVLKTRATDPGRVEELTERVVASAREISAQLQYSASDH